MSTKFEGVFVAVVTPFTTDGKLDEKALTAQVERLCKAGVHGIVPCGTTGEAPTLSGDERRTVITLSASIAKSFGKRVMVGCGSNSTATAAKYLQEAAEIGCDGALVVTPYYNKPTQAGLLAHYRALADKSSIPLVLYNVPGRTSVNISVETTLELFKHPNIVAIKESTGNHTQWIDLAAKMSSDKSLLAGDDDAFATLLGLGATGLISTSANVAPEAFVEIYEAAKANDLARTFFLQKRLLPLVRAMFVETNPAPVKAALQILGYMSDTVRLPLVTVSPSSREMIASALKHLELKK